MISTNLFAISDCLLSKWLVLKTLILIQKSVASYSMSFHLDCNDPLCMYVCVLL